MGKKVKTTSAAKAAVAEPTHVEEPAERSEAAAAKKENAALLAKQLKAVNAAVLASFDLKQATSAAKALQDY